jgi:hypothetical protein
MVELKSKEENRGKTTIYGTLEQDKPMNCCRTTESSKYLGQRREDGLVTERTDFRIVADWKNGIMRLESKQDSLANGSEMCNIWRWQFPLPSSRLESEPICIQSKSLIQANIE